MSSAALQESPVVAAERKRMYRLLAVGKRQLGLPEDDYRWSLQANGATLVDGKYSATTMSVPALKQVLTYMRELGFTPVHKQSDGQAKDAGWRQSRINKAYAIWCQLHEENVVRNRGWPALHKWSATITKKAKLEWADSQDLNAVIEGLKQWAVREHVILEQ